MATSKIIKRIYVKLYCLKHKSVKCQKGAYFNPTCFFEGNNFISMGTSLGILKMGFGSYIGRHCDLTGVKIGRYTCIGPYVKTVAGRHPTHDFVSVHPAFYATNHTVGFSYVNRNKFKEVNYAVDDGKEKYMIEIGNDVWIGAGVTIMDGVKIGDGAIVGANSLVLKDVEPYSIVGGTPAKFIRKRFMDEEIEFLLKVKWWNFDEQTMKKYADSFQNIAEFKKSFENDGQ